VRSSLGIEDALNHLRLRLIDLLLKRLNHDAQWERPIWVPREHWADDESSGKALGKSRELGNLGQGSPLHGGLNRLYLFVRKFKPGEINSDLLVWHNNRL
jgi:hypothetical protein